MESEGSSVINSAIQVAGPTAVSRSGQSKQANDPSVQGVIHRKPFKLRFGLEHDLGRSAVSSTKPLGLLPRLTPKFYTKETTELENDKIKQEEINVIKQKIDTLFHQGPRQKLILPRLESHNYGWYHDITFSEKKIDNRFNFGICSSPMVKYRILILANDRTTHPIASVIKQRTN